MSHRTLAGRYRLTALLGQGGAAAVYTATDLLLEREVAVKVLNHSAGADEATRFVAQARVLSQLNHPSIVRVFDADIDADAPYLVMELVRGTPLCDLLAEGPLPPERVAHVGWQLAGALVHAHERGVVHRDVKPRNVLLEPGDTARLADFGIVGLPEATRVTVTGQLLGAPAYVAPEQVRGDEVGPPADVYALGLLLLEALTGRPPFPGTPIESALARLERDVAVTDELPGSWRQALGAMTRREAASRPSAAAVQAWLAAPDVVALHAPAAPAAPPAPEPAAVPPRRHRAIRSAPARGSRLARWHRRSTNGVAWFATAAAMLVVALSGTDIEALVRPLRTIIAPPADAAPPDPSVGAAVARAADDPGALGAAADRRARGDVDGVATRPAEVRDSTTELNARPALEVAETARGEAARGRAPESPDRTGRPPQAVRGDAGGDGPAASGGGGDGSSEPPAPAPDPVTDPGTAPGTDPAPAPAEPPPRPPARDPEPPRSGPGEPVRGESPREGTGTGRDVGPPPDTGPGRDVGPPPDTGPGRPVGPPADAGPGRAIGVPAERGKQAPPPTLSSGADAAAAARATAPPDDGGGEG